MVNMIDIWTKAVLVGAAVSFAALLVLAVAWFAGLVRRTPWFRLVAALLFSGVAVKYGGAKQGATNEPPRGAYSPRVLGSGPSVTPEDIARGYRLESEATNAWYTFDMPANGTRHEKWWRRGAWGRV